MINKLLMNVSIAILVIVIVYACNQDSALKWHPDKSVKILRNNSEELEATIASDKFKLIFSSKGKSLVTSEVIVFSSSKLENHIFKSNFSVDFNATSYKLLQHKQVIHEAERLLPIMSESDINEVSALLESFGKTLISDSQINSSSNLLQSFFFHNAVINSIKRAKVSNSDCGCTPHPGYFIDKTNFWCQEDYLFSPKKALIAIQESNYKVNNTEMVVVDFLNKNQDKEFITIDKLFEVIETKSAFLDRIDKVYARELRNTAREGAEIIDIGDIGDMGGIERGCFKGSDWGCCGNYSGCCWYKSIICLVHDSYCRDCTPRWFCLPGCKPG